VTSDAPGSEQHRWGGPAEAGSPAAPSPEDCLEQAMGAAGADDRARWALQGLSAAEQLDTTTHAMLLRQLCVAHFERGQFARAAEIALQAAELGVLADVMHQDAARALHAAGDVDAAIAQLRLAARVGPSSRRAFHDWTLGSMLFVAGRHAEAISALERAARWGTTDKPLYQGHLALAKCRAGEPVHELGALIERLASCPAGRGYGRFVLGQLAFEGARYAEARRYLEAFVQRTEHARRPMSVALAGELRLARCTLAKLPPEG